MKMETSTLTLSQKLDAINEYERQPVPSHKLKGVDNFIGMFAGEHTAGTEFVIGPLFVAHGVTALDLLLGLIVGNLMAVLSWALVCAPIAVKLRVTLYYQLEKICGKNLVRWYNVVNGVMFCFLSGSMIAVSATAVGIPFEIRMPELNDWLPNSLGWILTVFGVGIVVTIVSILGYEEISRFSKLAAPWMTLVFVASAFAVMPSLGITSLSDFWQVAKTKIWTGVPFEGQSKFTFWHVAFFAWLCNMAMHLGLADMSIFRYAKKWQYGFSSAFGMFIGHFIAWIASGILCAAAQGSVTPGIIAYNSAGVAGAFCVIIAGWTTANPTIYRAGLAFQSLNPIWKRWKVTLITGLVTTFAACFPALVMKLLDFVALYGLLLVPMGAVIFVEFYFFDKLNLQKNLAELKNKSINWSAGIAWISTLALCLILNLTFHVEIFFLGLPAWIVAGILYTSGSKILQKIT